MDRPSAAAQAYREILSLMRGLVMAMLTDDELENLFEKGLVIALRNEDIQLLEELTAKMVVTGFVEDRDELKKKLRFRLRQNQERLTLQGLRTRLGVAAPTISEWIRLAEHHQDVPERPLALAIQDDENFTTLSPGEQEVVLRLMAIDDFLSLSSATPQGFEEKVTVLDPSGERYVIDGGEVKPAVDPETEQLFRRFAGAQPAAAPKTSAVRPPSAEDAANYRAAIAQLRTAHAAEDEARYEQQEALLQQVGGNVGQVIQTLKDAVIRADRSRLLTATMVVVRAGAVKDLLKDQAIRDNFITGILKPLADRAGVPLATVLAKLNADLDQPVYVGACLRWLLETALPGNPAEAARVGHQAEQLLGALGNTSLTDLTYFDARSGQFAWTQLRLTNDGMLEWAR
jgi:hypothetical protein